MKYLVPVMTALALLGGCKGKVEGQLNVTKEIKLRVFSGEKYLIKVGTYTADLSPNGKGRIALGLNNDKDERFNFAIPEGAKIPDNGTVSFTAAQVGQAADINISVATAYTTTQEREVYSSCVYQIPVQVCRPLPRGGMNCTIQYQNVWGQQWERFYDRITDKNVTLNVSEPNATEMSAQFLGHSTTAQRIIVAQSSCR